MENPKLTIALTVVINAQNRNCMLIQVPIVLMRL